MAQTTFTLYTRPGCHLCDHAKEGLLELQREWGFTLEEVNINESDELTEKYGLMIPVVEMDGEEVAYGNVNIMDISKRLQKKTSSI